MNFKRVTPLGLLFLAIPFLAVIYMIAVNELNYKSTTEYRVEITGYDPRDLLTGHYIIFQYDWPMPAKDSCYQDQCYACFTGKPQSPDIQFVTKLETKNCSAALALEGLQPNQKLQRYNIPDLQAPILDKMLRERNGKFSIGLLVFPDHSGQIKNLYIDDQKLSDFFN